MHNKRATRTIYKVGQWITPLATGVAVFPGVLANVDSQSPPYNTWPMMVLSAVKFLNDWSLLLYVIAAAMFFLGWLFQRVGNPWVWEKIQYLVDRIDKDVFKGLTRDRENRHRVTLFQRKRFVLRANQPGSFWFWSYGKGRHPWAGWLVPVSRSGHTAQTTRSIFYAPIDKNSHKVEGVVGQAWAENSSIFVPDLPDIQQNSLDEKAKKEYAKKTWSDINLVNRYASREQPPPRSIGAVPIEVGGKVWGALVFDSKAPKGVTNRKAKKHTVTVSLIGQLLEKA